MIDRLPLPPFSTATALPKVRSVENAWNGRTPASVALVYAADSRWRDKTDLVTGRRAIIAFLTRKWASEGEFRLIYELWAVTDDHVAVRGVSESRDRSGRWHRSHSVETWLFAPNGLVAERQASSNDVVIAEAERRLHWPLGVRLADHPGLRELGL